MNKGDGNSYGVSSRRMCHDSASLPSPLSAGSASGSGPGPIKSMSFTARKHRFTSEYYDHQTRRQMYHHSSPQQAQGDHVHRLPSPTSPTVNVRSPVPQQQHQSQQQRIQGSGATLSPASNVSIAPFSPLLKVPYPNLTLTLALMYVDRLKAKYPEEKGEAGCSQRLFLVAYIIAAKYRCSVELAVLLQENEDFAVELERRQQSGRDPAYQHEYTKAGRDQDDLVERVLKARSRAELIFSNHEWVRLLCLGSFFRPPPPPSSSTQHQQQQQQHQHQQQQQQQPQDQQRSFAAGALMKRSPSSQITTQPSSPASLASPKPEPLPCDTYRSGSLAHPAPHSHPYPVASSTAAPTPIRSSMASSPSLPSPAPSPLTPLAPSSSSPILRVEDLDRMETEFLTFLDFDLSARSHDLRTCWSLLVEKEV
ncbi:hypothetical protein BGX34_011951 [Mortierella sp. NVP85]|nr:hypothetical protein BGX34_011951 [Mortierella sp. NVP85]